MSNDDRELAKLFALLTEAAALAERLGLDVRIDLRPLTREPQEAHGFPPPPRRPGPEVTT